jgi:hypothetical protein
MPRRAAASTRTRPTTCVQLAAPRNPAAALRCPHSGRQSSPPSARHQPPIGTHPRTRTVDARDHQSVSRPCRNPQHLQHASPTEDAMPTTSGGHTRRPGVNIPRRPGHRTHSQHRPRRQPNHNNNDRDPPAPTDTQPHPRHRKPPHAQTHAGTTRVTGTRHRAPTRPTQPSETHPTRRAP